jgi:hypothetical protein
MQRGAYSARGPAASGTFPGRSSGSFAGRADGGLGQGNVGDAGSWEAARQDRQQSLGERRDEARQDWQDYGTNRREDWQDYADEHDDDHVHGYYGGAYYPYGAAVAAGAAVGAAASTAIVTPPYWTLPCTPATVVVGGTTYYACGSAWYVRAYSGGDVAYTMVNPPPGY